MSSRGWFSRTGTWGRSRGAKSAAITKVASGNVSSEPNLATGSGQGEEVTITTGADRPSSAPATGTTDHISTMSQEFATPAREPVVTHTTIPAAAAIVPPPELAPPESELQIPPADESSKDANSSTDTRVSVDPKLASETPEQAASYWFSWWYGRSPVAENPPPKSEASADPPEELPTVEIETPPEPPQHSRPVPSPLKLQHSNLSTLRPPTTAYQEPVPQAPPPADGPADNAARPRPKSWLGWLGGYQELPPDPKPKDGAGDGRGLAIECSPEPSPAQPRAVPGAERTTALEVPSKPKDQSQTSSNATTPLSRTPETSQSTPKASGWAFWYRDRAKQSDASASSSSITNVGEVAVAGSPSQFNPQKAKAKEIAPLSPYMPVTDFKINRALTNLREESRPSTPMKAEANTSTATTVSVTPKSSGSSSGTAKQKLQKILPTNHVLPNFDSCYRRMDRVSVFCQITKIFSRQPPPSKKHLYLTSTPLRIKKAVAIGVHGFFPMRFVRTVLGEPTGTSIRFANSAAAAIRRWAEKNGVEVEVEKIALEGEGKVGDRVETLWKLLSNWMDHVRSADFVVMAAHSQGVVVGVQLLARLIEEGCVDKARVGFTAMAGINLGPFYHLPTTILTGSAKELFEFQKLESIPSQKYVQALRICFAHNVRILYVGSIDDQLVPLESSTFSNISHPYIFRAVFVDGRVHAPDFLSHLVGFAMKLRNLGISDHGLIRELSSPLAGSLYGGEGHSRIYDDNAVYEYVLFLLNF